MTKEELENEAKEKFRQKYNCYPRNKSWFTEGYLAGAEPRENRLAELEKENAELKEELKDANEKVVHLACNQNKDLKKENAELKSENQKWKDGIALKDEEIGCIETEFNTFKSEAKEIIREFVEWATWQGNNCPNFKSIQDKAEQFLSEVEK